MHSEQIGSQYGENTPLENLSSVSVLDAEDERFDVTCYAETQMRTYNVVFDIVQQALSPVLFRLLSKHER